MITTNPVTFNEVCQQSELMPLFIRALMSLLFVFYVKNMLTHSQASVYALRVFDDRCAVLQWLHANSVFNLNTPEQALTNSTVADERLMNDFAAMGNRIENRTQEIRNIGTILKHGDLIDITKEYGLIK
ncbi:hypothetical protein [Photorhabdus asymbiotica]|uniref:hypothetical protein n=1 Tax=Photorhabdus asymbiotica TaxID=291112 RepID=UPI003DA6E04C